MAKWGKVLDGARASNQLPGARSGAASGAMIMKSVSIFLASGRRASNNSKAAGATERGTLSTSQSGASTSADPTKKRRKKPKPPMEDASGKINPKLVESLKKKTHFSKVELEALCRIYKKLVTNCHVTSRVLAANNPGSIIAKPHATIEGIDRAVFRELLHSTFDIVTEETLMERIFCAWDIGFEGMPLRLEGWIVGLSIFLRGTQAEKVAFCFRVYDLNSDGFITRDEMFILLRNCLIKQPQDEDPDEGVRDLVEIALRKFDHDKDGKVSFQDFSTAVTEEPLLLEAFGQCLPSESATISFLSTLQA
ncbi:calaxin-like [Lutzomyia longipalpis]|uniref:Putative ca2+ sensor ef-hand superfamily n=1 Tax=Lutzomyia longipalpis TaxID=7200 RepID=A0A1B0CG93_LUTLO|nr:calaxin-like [Lutzomyia longipalpis]XP_055682218.1 calaxin-like [Lutzomyia longipalpis]